MHNSSLRAMELAAVGMLLAVAAYYAATALFAIANFAWRVPRFDQFRLYAYYLSLPFPENVLQLENGHRPIVPALVRLFEIWCCAANQRLQIWVGSLLAAGSVAALVWLAWRERQIPLAIRAACTCASVLGVMWLAHARMLMHGNESLHTYMVVLSVIVAAWLAHRAAARDSAWTMSGATAACLIAMFSFGPGVAAFPAAALVALMRGARLRVLSPLVVGLVAALSLYLFALPGDEGVRRQVGFDPLGSAVLSLQWLASPWVHAWLVAADPSVEEWLTRSVAGSGWTGRALSASAAGVLGLTDGGIPGVGRVALVIGSAGVAAWCALGWMLWRRRCAAPPVEWVAFGMASFALATAVLIGVTRLARLAGSAQVFADRYLVWPSLFWSSLAVLALVALSRRRWQRVVAVAMIGALAVALYPTHRAWAGWSAASQRSAERTMAAAWLDVRGPGFRAGLDATPEQVELTLHRMRERRLGPFSSPPPAMPGDRLGTTVQPSDRCGNARVVREWPGLHAAPGKVVHVEGWCTTLEPAFGDWLVIVDAGSTVRGLARRSWIRPGAIPLRLAATTKRGYDGFIVGHDPHSAYRVVVPAGDGVWIAVGTIEPRDDRP